MPSSLYGHRQSTLVLGAGTSPATRLYFSSIRYEASQFRWLFIVYRINIARAKGAKLTPSHISRSVSRSCLCFSES